MLKSVCIRDKTLISKYPYKTTPLGGLYALNAFGMEVGAYGGRANAIAKVKNSPYYLVVDKNLQTVDVCVDDSEAVVESPNKKANKARTSAE